MGKVIILMVAYICPKFQHKPCINGTFTYMQITHAMGTDAPPYHHKRLVFALFIGNSLDGLFHLWHLWRPFFPKTRNWNVDSSDQRTCFHCLSVYQILSQWGCQNGLKGFGVVCLDCCGKETLDLTVNKNSALTVAQMRGSYYEITLVHILLHLYNLDLIVRATHTLLNLNLAGLSYLYLRLCM